MLETRALLITYQEELGRMGTIGKSGGRDGWCGGVRSVYCHFSSLRFRFNCDDVFSLILLNLTCTSRAERRPVAECDQCMCAAAYDSGMKKFANYLISSNILFNI